MVNKKPKSAVQDEQVGDIERNTETDVKNENTAAKSNVKLAKDEEVQVAGSISKKTKKPATGKVAKQKKPTGKTSSSKKAAKVEHSDVNNPEQNVAGDEALSENIELESENTGTPEDLTLNTVIVETKDDVLSDENPADEKVTPEEKKTEESEAQFTGNKINMSDYASLHKEDLVAILKEMLDKGSLNEIIHDVDAIKIHFYKKHKADIEKKRKKFLEDGGAAEDFMIEDDHLEKTMKEYLSRFREYKAEYNKLQEIEKSKNLEIKYKIIDEIKDLVNRKESFNKTFHEFRELQRRWRETGLVPQSSLKDLWETYHHHVETFYDYIKINQELRDLDLKKNLEAKLVLCEKAEELIIEPNVLSAFNILQTLHEQWREIGPVSIEMRSEIWNRFKEATSKINKNHQDYFLKLKQEQKNNLDAKTLLCEKVEDIANGEIISYQDWDKHSREIIELQKVWRTIGFAPKSDNSKIYKRFRDACDAFFDRKREYFSLAKQEHNNNLQLKTDLCFQAEALAESSEWKKTTEELIALQKRWKDIGPVPYKYSDKIWKRFRSACDKFFERKAQHFSTMDNSYESNLKKKEELIEKINLIQPSANVEENLKKLKELQREWAAIGFVPYEAKDQIQTKYRRAINKKFDDLKIDDDKKDLLKFKTKLEGINTKQNYNYRMNQEREKFITKLKELENDIVLWENNIGFFAKSKNAESMINEVQRKINDAKNKIEVLSEKIKMIDELDSD